MERPRQRSTATTPPTSRCSWPRRPASNPREFAELLAEAARGGRRRSPAVEIAGPGFLNITVEAGAQGSSPREIVEAGAAYGATDAFAGEKINLEFVSANPTGPMHIGGVRWAAVGDALGRIFATAGAEVTREYYFNDAGAQIDRFAGRCSPAREGEPAPEDGYGGDYIAEIAAAVVAAATPRSLDLPDDEAQEVFRREGVELMFDEIKQSLHDFGVDFDVYFHEKDLHESGAVERAIDRLTELGNIYEADGAIWLRTDRVRRRQGPGAHQVRRRAGPTSPATCAYYLDKRERGFDRCVIMLGADHHGYVGRLMAMCAGLRRRPRTRTSRS